MPIYKAHTSAALPKRTHVYFFRGMGKKEWKSKQIYTDGEKEKKSAKSGTAASILVLFFLKREKVAVKKRFLV